MGTLLDMFAFKELLMEELKKHSELGFIDDGYDAAFIDEAIAALRGSEKHADLIDREKATLSPRKVVMLVIILDAAIDLDFGIKERRDKLNERLAPHRHLAQVASRAVGYQLVRN